MKTDRRHNNGHHPIGIVSRRTGLKPDRIRAWERRYSVVTPFRTKTGRRLYTNEDIERLTVLSHLVASGWRISDLAEMTLPDLQELHRSELEAASGRSEKRGGDLSERRARDFRNRALDAVIDLDQELLEVTLNKAMLELSPLAFRQRVLVPLLSDVGTLWKTGDIRIVHEHLASAIVRAFIATMRKKGSEENRPRVLITTPAGQMHEFGALMAAAAAEESGWAVAYLGINLPAEEIAAGAAALGASVIAVSVMFKGDDAAVLGELRKIRQLVDPGVTLIVGGRGVAGIQPLLAEIGWVHLESVEDLQSLLERVLQ